METTRAVQPIDVSKDRPFLEELGVVWGRLENKEVFFALVIAWLSLFQFLGNSTFGYLNTNSLLHWMYMTYNHTDSGDSHGNLIPFVVLALFWWKREQLLSIPQRTWRPGLLLLGLACVMHLFGYLVQQPRLSIIALFLGLYSIIGITWGLAWMKASWFPFVLFVFSVPLDVFMDSLTLPLRIFATWITYVICHGVLGLNLIRQGTQLFDPAGDVKFDVVAACSGIRSLLSLMALTSIFAMVFFRSPWRRLVLFSSALPLSLICNILRLVCVVMASIFFGQKWGHFVHEWFGFLTYAIALGGVMILSRLIKETVNPARPSSLHE